MRIYNLEDNQLQETLISFLSEQAVARQDVRAAKQQLRTGMRNNLLSDAQILELLNNYRASVEQAKDNYQKALLTLDAKVGYSKNPRLETTLVMLGIIGDEAWFSYGPASFGIYAETPKAQPANPK